MINNQQTNTEPSNKLSDPKYITQNDFIFFKNELLSDIKQIESRMLSRLKESIDQNKSQIFSMNSKLNSFQTKLLELSTKINLDNSHIERINELFSFKSNIDEKFISQEKKMKKLNDYIKDSIYSMNKLFQENIAYAGVIGPNTKFQNFHAFIDFVIENINNLNSFKDKMISLDIQNYKTKFDKMMKGYKIQLDSIINSSQKMIKETLIIYDNKINYLINSLDNKISEPKNFLLERIGKVQENCNELNNNILSIKEELLKKFDFNKDEYDKKIENINLINDKYKSDFENINKKIEEMNDFIKFKISNVDDILNEQESNLLSKIKNSFLLNKKKRELSIERKNQIENPYKTFLNKDNLIRKEFDIFKSSDMNTKETTPYESQIKKYIESDFSKDVILRNKERKKLQNKSNDNENNIIKKFESEIIPLKNNVKIVKFPSKILNNNQDNSDNNLFIDRKKIDSYIVKKENIIVNKVPRNQIIKNLLYTTSEPIPNYFIKNEFKKINQKFLTTRRKNINFNKTYIPRFHHNIYGLEDLNDNMKRLTLSSSNSKTRNEQKFLLDNNSIDLQKENSNNKNKDINNIINIDKENITNVKINNNLDTSNNSIIHNNNKFSNLDKNSDINNILDKSLSNYLNTNKNKDIIQQDEDKGNIENKNYKKIKIMRNFNSTSKLFNLNINSSNISNIKYSINPIKKYIKIIRTSGSPLSQTLKLKIEKEKKRTQRPSIHYFLDLKNKNKNKK